MGGWEEGGREGEREEGKEEGREGRRKLAGKDSLVPPFLLFVGTQKWESDNIPLP